jgi:large-conductance mechanosensitive channel
MKTDESGGAPPLEDAGTFDRSFKYGVIIYAVVEFFAIALLLYYKAAR